ncbi:MAG: type III-A CRISPR-associated protein Csm2 [Blastocatellia bacterium]|nr:type III-A CRISPR-associated protein Csm2 [Blastocatellia bacterium]
MTKKPFNNPFSSLKNPSPQQQGEPERRPNPHSQQKGNDRNDRNEKTIDEVWQELCEENYLQNGYFDHQDYLRIELVTRNTIEPLVKEMANARPPLTNHQLRRFFQHCRAMEARLKAKQSNWSAERVALHKLDQAAADAFGKAEKKIPKIFHDFIKKNVATIETEKDFLDGFLKHFEALVGFSAQQLREKERR